MNKHYLIFIFAVVNFISKFNAKASTNKAVFEYLSDSNYTKVVRDYLIKDESRSLIAIMFTNNKCQTCDVLEPQLKQIQLSFRKENIPIFRCDISANKVISDKFQIKRFPVIHFVYKNPNLDDGQSSQIEIYKTSQILTGQIIQTAKYLRKILNFIGSKNKRTPFIQTLEYIPNQDKIVVNIEKIEKFYQFDEADFIHELMLDDSFNTMPIVPLSGQLFQFFSVSHSLEHLRQNAKTQIIIFILLEQEQNLPPITIPIQKRQFDRLISLNLGISSIFKSFLFRSAHQFTQSLYIFQQQFYSFQNPSIPIYLAVVDTIWKRKQARRQVMMLNQVLNTFENEILIFWIEAQINPEKKVLLGFNKDTQPPMFGKLILAKNQQKQPLKNTITSKPLFSQSDIKARIRTDLGYEKLLPQKIKSAIEQLGIGNFIEIANKIETQRNSSKIQFAYCTSKLVPKDELIDLEFIIKRFKRFYRDSSMTILTQPCYINGKSVEDGLYMSTSGKSHFLSSTIVPCIEIQPKVQQIARVFAQVFGKKRLAPQHFCVPERQMRDFLMSLKK